MTEFFGKYAKAIVAGLGAALTALAAFITGSEGFGDVTLNEWILVVLAVLGTTGVTWAVPNRES